MSNNNNAKIRKYGKNSLTSSYPSNNNSQTNLLFPFTNIGLPLNDENIASNNTRLTQSFDFLSKRKITDDDHKSLKARKKQELYELIEQGHVDYITLLHNSTKNEMFKSFKVVIPDRYNDKQRKECHLWLIDTLGFEEKLIGNHLVCYKHPTLKVGDFTDALSKLSYKLNVIFGSPNKSNFFNNNTFFNQTQEQNNNQNPTTTASTTNTTNVKNNDKFLLLRPTVTTVFNDDDDLIDRESPALFPTISTFSPSPVPPNQFPFLTSSSESFFRGSSYVSGSNSSGTQRQLPSPLDDLDHFLERGLQLGDSSSIKTRSSAGRLRASSIVSDDTVLVAMNSTSTRSRTASRAALEPPVILEGKCEDTMEEEMELVSQFTVQQRQPNSQLVQFTNVTAIVNNFFVPTPLYSSTTTNTTTTTAIIQQQQHVSNDVAKNNLIQSTQTTVEIEDTQPTNEEEDFSDASTVLDDSFIIEDKVENEAIFYNFSNNNDKNTTAKSTSFVNVAANKGIASEIPSFFSDTSSSYSNNHHLPPTGLLHTSLISPHNTSLLVPTTTVGAVVSGNPNNLKAEHASSPANSCIDGFEKVVVKKTKTIIRSQTEPLLVSHHHMSPGGNETARYTTAASTAIIPHPSGVSATNTRILLQTPVSTRPLDCACNYVWETSQATNELSITQLLKRFSTLMLSHEETPKIKRSISDPYSMSSYSSLHPAGGGGGAIHHTGLMQISPHHIDQQHNFYNNHGNNPCLQRSHISSDGIVESPTMTFRKTARNRMSQSTGPILGTIGVDATTNSLLNISSPHINIMSSSSSVTTNIGGEVPVFQYSKICKSDHTITMTTTFTATSRSSNEPYYESVRMQRKRIKSQAKLRRMSVCVRPPPLPPISIVSSTASDQHHHLASIAKTKQQRQQGNNSFNSFSPEPKTKCAKHLNQYRRKSTLFTQNDNNSGFINANTATMMNMENSQNHSHSGTDFDLSFGGGNGNNGLHDNSTLATNSNSDVKPHVIANPNLGSPIGMNATVTEMNESNFKGVIIGGVYQHCFDGSQPLVAAPAPSDKRIIDVKIKDDSSLVLSLYLPKDKTSKQVDLGIQWQWMRCSPTGYLTFRQSQQSFQVYYYLPKHPEDWKDDSDNNRYPINNTTTNINEHKRMSLAKQQKRFSIIPNHEYKGGFNKFNDISEETAAQIDIEMDCQPFVEAVEDSSPSFVLHPIKHTEEDENDYYIMSHGYSYGDLNLSSNQIDIETNVLLDRNHNNIDNEEDKDERNMIMFSSSEHWCNPNIMALILDFLIDDSALVGSIQTIQTQLTNILDNNNSLSTKTRRKVIKKTEESTSFTTSSMDNALQLLSYQCVNKAWALGTYIVIANRKSSFIKNAIMSFSYDRYITFVNKFKDGKFLSQGACKDVYCIRNPITNSLEAISVMDINDLIERRMENAITQELQISLLCSTLITLNICPNLVQVYSLFQSNYNAPKNLWKNNKSIKDVKNGIVNKVTNIMIPREKDSGKYQFIRMEFCTGGDVEELVRKETLLDITLIRSYLFQMCFSLYACREKLCLRHFDIKLLNFFVTDCNSLLQQSSKSYDKENQSSFNTTTTANNSNIMLQYGISNYIFKIPMSINTLSLVKLADFGTSYVGAIGLGDFITMQQFTTLENTPPEFLLLGSRARQSYASDTFPLGLCFLHMLTGYEPYEELLKDIHCPSYLARKLRNLWLTLDIDNQYYLLNEVIQSLDSDCYDEPIESIPTNINHNTSNSKNIDITGPEMILIDTLYRYLVLFGSSDEFQIDSTSSLHSCYHQSSPVWNIIVDALDMKNVIVSNHNKYSNKHNKNNNHDNVPIWNAAREKIHQKQTIDHHQCIFQYKQDLSVWSIHKGNHQIMIGLRGRLASLGNDASKLLDSMLHFDPSRRSTMYDALLHQMFISLRDNNCHTTITNNSNNNSSSSTNSTLLSYMHYYRGGSNNNINHYSHCDLPIL